MKLYDRSPWFSGALCLITLVSFARAHETALAPSPSCVDAVPEGLTAADWSSIRAAHEAERHSVVACEGGYRARNPAQQWITHFDGRGFTTTPDAGDWSWGLELESFGFPGAEQQTEGRASVIVERARVAYAWDSTLEEWYENGGRGLEHGYTLRERPTRDGDARGPLSFTLAVRGGLRAEVQADGRGLRFSSEDGATAVTYSGLSVFDAEGQDLRARFDPAAKGLRLIVHEDGARYPLTIDPIAQQAYLKASNTETDDQFGGSVSVSGETVVVGADGEDSSATGVNGNQSDNTSTTSGAAYVFEIHDASRGPGTPVCFGDGSGAPCGCGNEASPGSGGGCANAPPMPPGQGAVLFASGTDSTSADDLLLTVRSTTNQPGLFFQGDNAIGGGTGITFGDGIRCCGANVVRLEIADPPGASGSHTTSTTLPILGTSPPGTTAPGDSRCYQWWYRNPNRSECGFNFNLSNAVLVSWAP